MVESHRLQFTAKIARNLVIKIREQCFQNEIPGCMENTQPEKITMLGFSFGAHIASQACRDIFKSTNKKVGKLIGVSNLFFYDQKQNNDHYMHFITI